MRDQSLHPSHPVPSAGREMSTGQGAGAVPCGRGGNRTPGRRIGYVSETPWSMTRGW